MTNGAEGGSVIRFLLHLQAVGKQSNRERYLPLHLAMSPDDIVIFHVFQAREVLPPSDTLTVPFWREVGMAASTRGRGSLGRWPTGATMVGTAALGILALLGSIHSAKGASFVYCFAKGQVG